jgi:hypothetical protein
MAHNIAISKVENGVIVNVGCKTFVSEDIEGAMKEVARYLMSPDAVEREYNIKYNIGSVVSPVDRGNTTLSPLGRAQIAPAPGSILPIDNGGIYSGT